MSRTAEKMLSAVSSVLCTGLSVLSGIMNKMPQGERVLHLKAFCFLTVQFSIFCSQQGHGAVLFCILLRQEQNNKLNDDMRTGSDKAEHDSCI